MNFGKEKAVQDRKNRRLTRDYEAIGCHLRRLPPAGFAFIMLNSFPS